MAPTARTIQPRFRGAAASLLLLVLLALAFHWSSILERPARITLAGTGTSPGSVTSVKRRPEGGLDITTQTSREGYLLLSEVRYPGWRATVDGRQVPLERADYLITALPLPPGGHQVTYRYHPLSFRIGAWGTFSSLIIASAIVGRGVREGSSPAQPCGLSAKPGETLIAGQPR